MKTGLALYVVLVASGLSAGTAGAESQFEQLVRLNGCAIPFPVENLRERLATFALPNPPAGVTGQDALLGTMIPNGRSLQAGDADLRNPRLLISLSPLENLPGGNGVRPPNARALSELSSRIFIAYTENANELEIVSWDNELGRYSFQRVRNYAPGQRPVILGESYRAAPAAPTQRQLCLECHQAGGPIFSRFPWRETNANRNEPSLPVNSLARRMIDANGGHHSYHGFDISPPEPRRKLLVDVLDRNIRAGNRLLQARNACNSMCGPNLECRRLLLKTALARRNTSNFILGHTLDVAGVPPPRPPYFARLQTLLAASWPANGFEHASSVLPDRDPLVPDGPNGNANVFQIPRAAGDSGDTFDETQASSGLLATREQHVAADSNIGDPAQPRPMVGRLSRGDAAAYAVDVAFECLGFLADDVSALEACSADQLETLLASVPVGAALQTWPLISEPPLTAQPLRNAVLGQAATLCGPGVPPFCPIATTTAPVSGRAERGLDELQRAVREPAGGCPALQAPDGSAPLHLR